MKLLLLASLLAITSFAQTEFSFVGCFKDDGDRDLDIFVRRHHNPQTCSRACDGYLYFALQNHGECRCGNHYSSEAKYEKVDDSQCGSDKKGRGWRNAVFAQTKDRSTYTLVGNGWCRNSDGSRLGTNFDDSMKVHVSANGRADLCEERCDANSNCIGYMTEDKEKCQLLINTDNNTGDVIHSADTEKRNYCWKKDVAALEFSYIGCFKDDKYRDLETFVGSGHNSETCSRACEDYHYFALQAHGECRCGNHFRSRAKYEKVDDSQCGSDKKGRGWRNAVFAQTKGLDCAEFSTWPHVDKGLTCGNCRAMVSTSPYDNCEDYCQSFGHRCVLAEDDGQGGDNCDATSFSYSCTHTWSGTTDMLCTCALESSGRRSLASNENSQVVKGNRKQ